MNNTRVSAGFTRLSIGSQIQRATELLGMTYEVITAPGGGFGYLIDDVRMTVRDAADYLLAGGFDEAFGRSRTVAHPDRLDAKAAAKVARDAGDFDEAARILNSDMPKPSW